MMPQRVALTTLMNNIDVHTLTSIAAALQTPIVRDFAPGGTAPR